MRHLLLFLLLSPLALSAQRERQPFDFPAERHAALREELVYEPEERFEPEPEAEIDFSLDLSSLRSPWVLSIAVLLLVGLGILVYRITKDLRSRPGAQLPSRGPAQLDETVDEEQLVAHGVADKLLTQTESNEQYALAIRLRYLNLLKALQDTGQLRYRKDYSNADYRRQLHTSPLLPAFDEVTRNYERYWYGDYPVDALSYRLVRQQFLTLHERIGGA